MSAKAKKKKLTTLPKREPYSEKMREYAKNRLLKKCSNCSMCRDECPTYYSSYAESFYAGGRLRILRTFVERGLPMTDDFVNAMFFCTTCKQCEDICPISMEYVDIIEDLRAEVVEKLGKPHGNLLNFARNVYNFKNPYGEAPEKRKAWLPEDVKEVERGPYAYFVGCTASFRTISAAQNTSRILSKLLGGIVVLGSGEFCCGSPLIRTGQVDFDLSPAEGRDPVRFKVKDLISHNVDALVMREVKEVIFSCSGCYKTSTDDWPRLFDREIPFKRTHITQFLSRMLDEGKLQLGEYPKTITYHDPCHLGRHRGEYDAPRRVLAAIPGAKFVEMRKVRNRSRCCGAGAGVKAGFPDKALEIAKIRVLEAKETGADVLATSCVFCKYNFLDAVKALDLDLEVVNIEDIIASIMK
ncbi:MAG: (Fe-S)-binding protein [Promethearchaeota archaeon]